MRKLVFILLLVVSSLTHGQLVFISPQQLVSSLDTVTSQEITWNFIADFGAIGDGETDNYKAFIAAADFANQNKNTKIFFPKGHYYIATFRTKREDNATIPDIIFRDCEGLEIYANNDVVISTYASFHRSLDRTTADGRARISYTNAITPFLFIHCKNVILRGFEINGNIQNATRDATVTEGTQIGVRLIGGDNITLQDLYIHHCGEDGLYIGGSTLSPSTNINLINVKSYNNARQGLTIGGVNGVNLKNCEFKYTGLTGGYGAHSPKLGVDIEPAAQQCSNVKFENCTFQDNNGGQIVVTYPHTTSNITLLRCNIIADDPNSNSRAMGLHAKNVLVDSCLIRIGRRVIRISRGFGGSLRIINSEIESSSGITDDYVDSTDSVYIGNNFFKFQGEKMTSPFPSLNIKNLQFIGNRIYIPSVALKARKGIHCSIENAMISKGNLFYSEDPTIKPKVDYTGTLIIED